MTVTTPCLENPPAQHLSPRRAWLGVTALGGATFTVVTSEMLPVGLLTPMGASLGVSEGAAGFALTVTGLMAAVSAAPLTAWLGRFDRRTLLCVLLAVVAVGNLAAACAPGYAMLMAGRVLVGAGMGGVWALAASVTVRLAPARSMARALSVVFSGVAVASVLGVPAGTVLGSVAGWRAAYVAVAGLSVAVLLALALTLPRLPAEGAVSVRGALRRAIDPRVRVGLIVVALLVTGHFAAYTYVRPVLEQVAGVGAAQLGLLLLIYGIVGVAGNFVSGSVAAVRPRALMLVLGATIAVSVALLPVLGTSALSAGMLLAVWGLAYGGVSVGTQTWVLTAAPDARESVSAVYVSVFNAAIGCGALVGGFTADGFGSTAAMALGAGLALAAVVAVVVGPAEKEMKSAAPRL
ncbi:MFS transporter [Nocardia puris]|uniref:Putative MFS family arabinose efflux permease n=1 Tax=Nocardia puris TaxID=208602 RepID=A0A366E3F5_9NOCA|nr:MFS transporter [Nocardia puris]MBF6214452.1 MFS transporter [Nocardia puris]MBF6369067.1 MFS transporter [Nocardia puris]MBF6462785.1 MFS transporter [Nocardia puris]RBO96837.1 putative MFS family arabinose efflux permease [Nocardia puris]